MDESLSEEAIEAMNRTFGSASPRRHMLVTSGTSLNDLVAD